VAYASGETGNMDIFARRLDANLTAAETLRMTSDTGDQNYPSLNYINGQFILLYDTMNAGSYDIVLDRFYRNWTRIDKAPLLAVTGTGDQTWPSIAYSSTEGIYWIAYASQDTEGQNIYVSPVSLPSKLRACDTVLAFSATKANSAFSLTARFYNNYGELTDPLDIGLSWSPQDAVNSAGAGLKRVSKGVYQMDARFGAAGQKTFRVMANIDGCLSVKEAVANVT
jgi:hypothetical protein